MSAASQTILTVLGKRLRSQRARRGMTRRQVAQAAKISERHIANIESGQGNVSIVLLDQIAQALDCTMADLLGESNLNSPEHILLAEILRDCEESQLQQVRELITDHFQKTGMRPPSQRIALLGLRGAGKTTLGEKLAQSLGFVFIELSRETEKLAGCSTGEILALYGIAAYHRYERRALSDTLAQHPQAVIAIPGALVADAQSFNQLLQECRCIWLQATPEDHMSRVISQGDLRPMQSSQEAMEDLRQILQDRSPFYSKAEKTINTSQQTLAQTSQILLATAQTMLRG